MHSKRPCERGLGAWRSRPPCGSGRTPRPERGCQQTPVEWPAAGLGRSASSRLLLCTVYTHIHTTGTEVCMLISYIRLFTSTIVYKVPSLNWDPCWISSIVTTLSTRTLSTASRLHCVPEGSTAHTLPVSTLVFKGSGPLLHLVPVPTSVSSLQPQLDHGSQPCSKLVLNDAQHATSSTLYMYPVIKIKRMRNRRFGCGSSRSKHTRSGLRKH